jgi:uncharacterized protein YbcI
VSVQIVGVRPKADKYYRKVATTSYPAGQGATDAERGAEGQSHLANISRRIVQLHKEYYGKGPTKARTHYHDDVVLVLLRGGFTKVEATLLEEGRTDAVISQRMEFQDVMVDRFKEVIREELGREVVAFMSGNHQDPDLIAQVFVLETDDEPLRDAHAAGHP